MLGSSVSLALSFLPSSLPHFCHLTTIRRLPLPPLGTPCLKPNRGSLFSLFSSSLRLHTNASHFLLHLFLLHITHTGSLRWGLAPLYASLQQQQHTRPNAVTPPCIIITVAYSSAATRRRIHDQPEKRLFAFPKATHSSIYFRKTYLAFFHHL